MNQMNMSISNSASKLSENGGRISWPEASSMKQIFSLPDSIIYYISKNPSTPEVYVKLAQSCKYFFEKNPIIVAARIHDGGTRICSNDQEECELKNHRCCKNFNVQRNTRKIWLTNELYLSSNDIPNFAALLVPKLYQCEEAKLHLFGTTITMEDFELLATKFQKYSFDFVETISNDGSPVMLERILESIPNVIEFSYMFDFDISFSTASTMSNILKLQNMNGLRSFCLTNIPEDFNVKKLEEFIMKQKNTKIWFTFSMYISEEYKKQLDTLVDTVIVSKIVNPLITYSGQDEEKLRILCDKFF